MALKVPNNQSLPYKPRKTTSSTDPFTDETTKPGNQDQSLDDAPFWGDHPKTWDTVTIGDITLPGLASVSGKISMRKDRKKVAGKNGARVTHIGYEPSEVNITLKLWTKEHWLDFKVLAGQIRPKRGEPKAFDIAHPAVAIYSIASVIILEAGLPKPDGDLGIFTVEIKAMEWFPPSAPSTKVTSPKSASPNAQSNVIYTPGVQASFQPTKPSDTSGENASFEPNTSQNQSLP